MRVVAGAYAGRRLAAPRGAGTRPTADRVREALFSILGPVDGLRVLDLYAGSGALGIEALSRGARRAPRSSTPTPPRRGPCGRTSSALGVGRGRRVFRADALSFLRGAARTASAWDLVFCDPPYRLAPPPRAALGPLLAPVLGAGARIVCESSVETSAAAGPAVIAERRYGDTLIAIHAAPAA